MENFEAIKFVTGGATLAALIVIALMTVLRSAIGKDVELLKSVEGTKEQLDARERTAQSILEKFHVDTAGMSSADKKELALTQLYERRKRLTVFLGFALALSLVGAVITIVVMRSNGGGTGPSGETHGSAGSSTGATTVQISGDHGTNVAGSGNTTVNK